MTSARKISTLRNMKTKTNAERQKSHRQRVKEFRELLKKYIKFDGTWTVEAINDWHKIQSLLTAEELDALHKKWRKK